MIRPIPALSAMGAYALADPAPPGALSLSQNESAFAPSPRALEAGALALADSRLYPDPDWTDLRCAIAAAHGLPAEQILCGAGSMELIGALIRAYAGPGDDVLGTEFGYLFVATACRQSGAAYVRVAETGFTVAVDRLIEAAGPRCRIVFLCNPGNPTGTRIPNAEILRLRAHLPDGTLLVVDQAYGEFDRQDPRAVFDLAARGDTVVLRSFSKAYGLAGARVGWALLPHAVASQVRKLLNPNNVSAVSQAMAAAAMRDEAHMLETVAKTARIRDRLVARLRSSGYDLADSHTNFVLIPFPNVASCRLAFAALKAEGLVLRGMEAYGLPHALRVTIGPEDAMQRVADMLAPFAAADSSARAATVA